jgi:ABC-type uncharacterized transport system involved in gliding motility auxiliary subunit
VAIVASQSDTAGGDLVGQVTRYLQGGGKLLLMASGMSVTQQAPFAMARRLPINEAIKPYGVQIRTDMVYDLKAAQVVSVPTNMGRVLRSYPYFLFAQSTQNSPINAEIDQVGMAWPSSIDTTGAAAGSITQLFVTTDEGGAASGTAMIDPGQQFSRTDLGVRVLGVQVQSADTNGARLVVVGNSIMASDEFVQRNPINLAFALNAVDWLAQDEALIEIRAKDRRPPNLVYSSTGKKNFIKYFNVVGLPLLIGAFGLARMVKRKKLSATPYRRLSEAV